MKVLLIGNDEQVLEKIHASLRARGASVVRRRELSSPAGDGAASAAEFGLVVMVALGGRGLGAQAACRALRAVPGGDGPVVLVVTDEIDADGFEALLEAGANDFLAWPRAADLMTARLAAAEQRAVDRRRLRAATRAAEARFKSFLDGAPVLLHTTDAEGRVLSVSDGWLELLGYQRGEVIGTLSLAFLTEASRKKMADEILPEFFARGAIRDVVHEFQKKDGQVVRVRLWAMATRDAAGEIVGASVFGVPTAR